MLVRRVCLVLFFFLWTASGGKLFARSGGEVIQTADARVSVGRSLVDSGLPKVYAEDSLYAFFQNPALYRIGPGPGEYYHLDLNFQVRWLELGLSRNQSTVPVNSNAFVLEEGQGGVSGDMFHGRSDVRAGIILRLEPVYLRLGVGYHSDWSNLHVDHAQFSRAEYQGEVGYFEQSRSVEGGLAYFGLQYRFTPRFATEFTATAFPRQMGRYGTVDLTLGKTPRARSPLVPGTRQVHDLFYVESTRAQVIGAGGEVSWTIYVRAAPEVQLGITLGHQANSMRIFSVRNNAMVRYTETRPNVIEKVPHENEQALEIATDSLIYNRPRHFRESFVALTALFDGKF